MKLPAWIKWERGESFAIQKPNLYFLWLTVIFLVGYFILGEAVFRLRPIKSALTGPRIGSRHSQFEIQIARLEKLVSDGETIDCIFLGNSMVWLGINPLIVSESFKDQTGDDIHCFNFGVSALPASSAGQIAPMLVDRYHPKVLIYGAFARDYAIPASAEDAYVVTDTAWLKYQNGDFNIKGWLYSHSAVFQYSGHMHDILFMRYLEDVFAENNNPPYQAYGLDPKYDIRTDVNNLPDFESKDNRDPVNWLGHFHVYQENLEGLNQVLQQSDKGIEVIVVEMPFHENAYTFFPNGIQDYESYVQLVDSATASNHAPFWRADDQPILTPDDWWDYFHLNLQGADIFSEWLGSKLAESYLDGSLELYSSTTP